MSIVKIDAGLASSPSVFAQPVLNQIAALLTDCNHRLRINNGVIKSGSIFNIGGSFFISSGDTSISGTQSGNTINVKFTVSGSSATVEYITDVSGVTWNSTQQGYYDTDGNYYYIQPKYIWVGTELADITRTGSNYYGAVYINTNYNEPYSTRYKFISPYGGLFRIYFTYGVESSVNDATVYVKCQVNGIDKGIEHSTNENYSTHPQTAYEDIDVKEGDIITILAHSSALLKGYRVMNSSLQVIV